MIDAIQASILAVKLCSPQSEVGFALSAGTGALSQVPSYFRRGRGGRFPERATERAFHLKQEFTGTFLPFSQWLAYQS